MLFVVFFLLALASVEGAALDFSSYAVFLELDGGLVGERVELTVSNASLEGVEFLEFSFGPVQDASATVDGVAAQVAYTQDSLKVFFPTPLPPGGSSQVVVKFSKEGLVEPLNGFEVLSLSFTAPEKVGNFSIAVTLQEGFFIPEEKGVLSQAFVSPKPSSYSTDGRRISVQWKASLEKGESFPIFVKYARPSQPEGTGNEFLALAALLAVVALAWLAFTRLKGAQKAAPVPEPLKEAQVKHRENVVRNYFELLQDSERQVLKFLEQGQKTQAELLELTGFSKAKLSRLLASLEQRKVIERTLVGRTNVVKLPKKTI